MTIGQLQECLFGKACGIYGAYGDCTAFASKGANYDTYGPMLTKMGYHNSGNQLMYSGFTGEQLYSEIFIGPTYYMRLKHMVKDKINYRATGKRNFLTRQTNQGRANDGGLKIGEMERDSIMANGLSYFLNESYMVRGDQYYMGICNKSGAIAIYNPDANLFLSPFADGPLVFNKNVEGNEVLNAVSKFGRSFSIVRIPFAMKLLIQELQVMNIQMRIITEDNIDQLLNLSYQSRNIDKLLHIEQGEAEIEVKTIIENYKRDLDNLVTTTTQPTRPAIIQEDIEHQEFSPYTPPADSQPADSPPYAPADSPPYAPADSPPLNSPLTGGESQLHPFADPLMNNVFNNLSKDNQHQILGLDDMQRHSVMYEIMRKSSEVDKSKTILGGAFDALPVDKKLVALQGGYNSMAKDFGGMAKIAPQIKIHQTNPPIYEQLAGKLPLLSIDEKTPTPNDTTATDDTKDSSTLSNGSSVKRITI
jgi:hypothetical protein